MKKIVIGTLVLFCMTVFIPAAFAEDMDNCRPWFTPTLRVGLAVDARQPSYNFTATGPVMAGLTELDLEIESVERPYLALDLPFAVTDRLTITLGGDWSFSAWKRDNTEIYYVDGAGRAWDSDGTAHWVSTDLLVSYALIKDRPILKDLSVVAGIRWDYQTMSFDNPHNVGGGVTSSPADTADFRMQTLAPVAGISLTVGGLKSGIWLGDVHLRVLAGPIVWGHEDYRETFGVTATVKMKGDLNRGYIVKCYGDFTLLSGKITPTMEGSLAFFAEFTKTGAAGGVDGTVNGVPGTIYPFDFESDNATLVFGLGASLAFDICEPAPAPVVEPAPPIEPKLEPMSFK
jgi:hypothetical protein